MERSFVYQVDISGFDNGVYMLMVDGVLVRIVKKNNLK
jgi:hypothetical protein